ncbi:hypothetical protein BsWGS_09254 [Bradybaena similaris]
MFIYHLKDCKVSHTIAPFSAQCDYFLSTVPTPDTLNPFWVCTASQCFGKNSVRGHNSQKKVYTGHFQDSWKEVDTGAKGKGTGNQSKVSKFGCYESDISLGTFCIIVSLKNYRELRGQF